MIFSFYFSIIPLFSFPILISLHICFLYFFLFSWSRSVILFYPILILFFFWNLLIWEYINILFSKGEDGRMFIYAVDTQFIIIELLFFLFILLIDLVNRHWNWFFWPGFLVAKTEWVLFIRKYILSLVLIVEMSLIRWVYFWV